MKPIRLVSGFLTVGAWTLVSRVLGFARDILIAAYLGAGPVAEAFVVAFSLPNMFRRFFAEGAFNTAFVPLFAKKLEARADAAGFAGNAFSWLGLLLALFSLLALVLMPLLVLAMASGFVGDVRFVLTVELGRMVFVYIVFISLAALLSGVLNSLGHFAAAAAAPAVLNLILIVALLIAVAGPLGEAILPAAPGARDLAGAHHGTMLAWGVALAGVAQLALVAIAARRAGMRIVPSRPRITPDIRRLAAIAAPAMLAGGVVQINLLIGRQVASYFDGAVVWLYNADRLYQLPLGMVAVAIGVVLLPDLSRRLAAGDSAGGRRSFNRAAEIALALTVPAAAALAVMPGPIVSVLFERGAFEASDSAATAAALAVYGLGLPAFVLQKVLQPLYFAREDTRTPFRHALAAMLVNAVAAIGLAPVVGYLAAAIGASLAGWAMVILLWRGSRGMGEAARLDARFRDRFWRMIASTAIMVVSLVAMNRLLASALADSGSRYGALALLVGGGIAAYFAAAHFTGALGLGEIRRIVRRRV